MNSAIFFDFKRKKIQTSCEVTWQKIWQNFLFNAELSIIVSATVTNYQKWPLNRRCIHYDIKDFFGLILDSKTQNSAGGTLTNWSGQNWIVLLLKMSKMLTDKWWKNVYEKYGRLSGWNLFFIFLHVASGSSFFNFSLFC